MTDSSFKLFAAEPSPGHDPKKLMLPPTLPPAASTSALTELPARDFDPTVFRNQQIGGAAKAEEPKAEQQLKPPVTDGASAPAAPEKKEVVRGPWRILRLLPRESRHVIGRMLEIDPKKRAKMGEILDDVWVANTVICRQMDGGVVVKAEDHTHILEPPSSTPTPGGGGGQGSK